MKTEDELDAQIAKLFDEDTTPKVEMVNGKTRISDEQTLREMQFAEACEELVAAEGEFAEWDAKATQKWAHPDADPANLCHWFVSFRQACMNSAEAVGIVGCPLHGGRRMADENQESIRSRQ